MPPSDSIGAPGTRPQPELTFEPAPAGRGFRLTARQWLPLPPSDLYPFFADAGQLERLTPPWLRFAVLTPLPVEMQAGTLLDYRLRLHGIPLRWQSRIAVWEPPRRFVDEQVRGPYRWWRHEHVLEADGSGTLLHDVVDYGVPLGRWAHWLLVQGDLRRIFNYRRLVLQELFAGSGKPS